MRYSARTRTSAFQRDSHTDDTRMRTAVSWLEEAELLSREENRVQVFPSSLRVNSVEEAKAKLQNPRITGPYRNQLLTISQTLIEAAADEGISTDELMAASGLTPEGVRAALYDLERFGIASNDTALTAFVHKGVQRASPESSGSGGRIGKGPDLSNARGSSRHGQRGYSSTASPRGHPTPQGRRQRPRSAGAAVADHQKHRSRRARRGRR